MGFIKNNNIKGKVNDSFETLFTKGLNGDPGKSIYEIMVEDGYQGTEEEFADQIMRLKGTYNHINGENYNFEKDQPVYAHDDELLYRGRSITEMFNEMENRLSMIEKAFPTTTTLKTGLEVNDIMSGIIAELYMSGIDITALNITFSRSSSIPDGMAYTDISVNNDNSIVLYWDNGFKYYTDADIVYMNEDSSNLFGVGFTELNDIDNWDSSNVTNMDNMFWYTELTNLDLSHFDTSNVTSMDGMFNECSKLESLNLSSFDTSNVTNMSEMFKNCSALTSLDLSNFNTSKLTNMQNMFSNCTSLESLNLMSFDVHNVHSMRSVFDKCSSLSTLDLSAFDTSSAVDVSFMFSSCAKLTTIVYGNNFTNLSVKNLDSSTTLNNSYCMFKKCPANKPTGGGWNSGTWNSDGTFIKS